MENLFARPQGPGPELLPDLMAGPRAAVGCGLQNKVDSAAETAAVVMFTDAASSPAASLPQLKPVGCASLSGLVS